MIRQFLLAAWALSSAAQATDLCELHLVKEREERLHLLQARLSSGAALQDLEDLNLQLLCVRHPHDASLCGLAESALKTLEASRFTTETGFSYRTTTWMQRLRPIENLSPAQVERFRPALEHIAKNDAHHGLRSAAAKLLEPAPVAEPEAKAYEDVDPRLEERFQKLESRLRKDQQAFDDVDVNEGQLRLAVGFYEQEAARRLRALDLPFEVKPRNDHRGLALVIPPGEDSLLHRLAQTLRSYDPKAQLSFDFVMLMGPGSYGSYYAIAGSDHALPLRALLDPNRFLPEFDVMIAEAQSHSPKSIWSASFAAVSGYHLPVLGPSQRKEEMDLKECFIALYEAKELWLRMRSELERGRVRAFEKKLDWLLEHGGFVFALVKEYQHLVELSLRHLGKVSWAEMPPVFEPPSALLQVRAQNLMFNYFLPLGEKVAHPDKLVFDRLKETKTELERIAQQFETLRRKAVELNEHHSMDRRLAILRSFHVAEDLSGLLKLPSP